MTPEGKWMRTCSLQEKSAGQSRFQDVPSRGEMMAHPSATVSLWREQRGNCQINRNTAKNYLSEETTRKGCVPPLEGRGRNQDRELRNAAAIERRKNKGCANSTNLLQNLPISEAPDSLRAVIPAPQTMQKPQVVGAVFTQIDSFVAWPTKYAVRLNVGTMRILLESKHPVLSVLCQSSQMRPGICPEREKCPVCQVALRVEVLCTYVNFVEDVKIIDSYGTGIPTYLRKYGA
ncbi:hypothetical protein B0H14DRAFT_2648531 [Mycena olivaceomarginata]|nr:hypothetical protein B0H14DRAFT_2648531 [Mycena olivaceomarginata]